MKRKIKAQFVDLKEAEFTTTMNIIEAIEPVGVEFRCFLTVYDTGLTEVDSPYDAVDVSLLSAE